MSAPSKSNFPHEMSGHALHIWRLSFLSSLMTFVGKRTEHVLHLFWTDIDVIRPENLMEFVLMEKTEGSRELF